MKPLIALSFTAVIILSFTYKHKKFKTADHCAFIPSGTLVEDEQEHSVMAFWMLDHEVTNFEYRTFLNALKSSNQMEDFQKAYPDTAAWKEIGGYMDPMMEAYFWHPAYDNYPVVNVSKEGAELYCKYLTGTFKTKYGDVLEDFRLPTKVEWIWAAKGGLRNTRYPWFGPTAQNVNGEYLANFFVVGDQNITTVDGQKQVVPDSLIYTSPTALDVFITAPSKSYVPNDFGLYDMSGNVAEMVADENLAMGGHWKSTGFDIQVNSSIEFTKACPFVGFRPVMTYLKTTK